MTPIDMLFAGSTVLLTVAIHIQIAKYNAKKAKEMEAQRRKNALIDSFAVENIKEWMASSKELLLLSIDDKDLVVIFRGIVSRAMTFARVVIEGRE